MPVTRAIRHVLTIPNWHPVRLNQLLGCHWARRGRLKRQDRNLVAVYARLGCIPQARGRRRVGLTLTMAPRQRCPDPDCFWKSLNDALVHAGLLVDDGPKWCELGRVRFQRGAAK